MHCCLNTLAGSRRPSGPGTRLQCPVCSAVIRVDLAGAWVWDAPATAEALRMWSDYG